MCRWAGRAAPRVITCPIRASRRLASTGASSTGGCRSTIERGRYAAHRHLPDAAGVGAAGAGGGVRDPERRAPAPARDFRARARYVERRGGRLAHKQAGDGAARSEEHTSELQSLMRISYAVFCLKKKTTTN